MTKAYEISNDVLIAVMTLIGPLEPPPVYDGQQLTVDDAHIDLFDTILSRQDIELEAARRTQLAALADRRWRAETGGIVVGGVPIATDVRSKTMIMGARIRADADPEHTVRWKTAAGFIDLDAATIIAVSDAVLAHVAACFEREDVLTAAIEAAETVEAVEAIDIESGWP